MPTYTYKCSNCGVELEIVHPMSEDPRTYCEKCGREELKRVINGTGGGFRIYGRGVHKPTSRIS